MKHSQGALRNTQIAMTTLAVLGGLAATTSIALAATAAHNGDWQAEVAVCVAVAGASAGGWRLLRALEKRLTFTDYCHAER